MRQPKILVASLVVVLWLASEWLQARPPATRALADQSLPALVPTTGSFVTSIDTMKESRDTETRPLTDAEIADDVGLAARLNTTYITVDTHWDYPDYMQRWVAAIRATGRHVWFRIHPNQWGNNNGTTGIMAPAAYESSEQSFLLAHPALFQPGDILDPCPEPENGLYWKATYGSGWTSGAPNAVTREYNAFIRATTDIADAALLQNGIAGVITTVRSTNSFFATHPGALEAATVTQMGRVTVDSYPEGTTTDPAVATSLRVSELNLIERTWGVPVVVGEMGYSDKVIVDDATQEAVLKAEFNGLAALPYLAGVNYWVGAGTDNSGGYTHIFSGATGSWMPRPAAADLAAFYGAELSRGVQTETPVPVTPTSSQVPPTTPTPAASPTTTASSTIPPSPTASASSTIPASPTASATMTPLPPTATTIPASVVATASGTPLPTIMPPTATGTGTPLPATTPTTPAFPSATAASTIPPTATTHRRRVRATATIAPIPVAARATVHARRLPALLTGTWLNAFAKLTAVPLPPANALFSTSPPRMAYGAMTSRLGTAVIPAPSTDAGARPPRTRRRYHQRSHAPKPRHVQGRHSLRRLDFSYVQLTK